jgi:hypothetical protein
MKKKPNNPSLSIVDNASLEFIINHIVEGVQEMSARKQTMTQKQAAQLQLDFFHFPKDLRRHQSSVFIHNLLHGLFRGICESVNRKNSLSIALMESSWSSDKFLRVIRSWRDPYQFPKNCVSDFQRSQRN